MSLVRFRPEAPPVCGFSSFGRASPCQGEGGGFEPRNPLQKENRQASLDGFLFGVLRFSKPARAKRGAGQRLPLLARANMTAFSRQGNLVTCGLPQVCRALVTMGSADLFCPMPRSGISLGVLRFSKPTRAKRHLVKAFTFLYFTA